AFCRGHRPRSRPLSHRYHQTLTIEDLSAKSHVGYRVRLSFLPSLPAGRLNWNYLRKLHRGNGLSSVQLDGYYFLESESLPDWKRPLRKMWQWHMLASIAACCGTRLRFQAMDA